ncbi:MAG TPA: RNA 2',3'-cyclic phosphodiesterase [Anaerolineae bacterium]|nr:RNA 2',3'-cyclic phosphodiesterase [Anaerolineae bacterium]
MDAIRAFIAIELPAAILQQIGEIESRLKPRLPPDCIRWVKPDSIHLTLKFLGQVPSDQIALITASLKAALAAHHPFALEVAGAGCFPDLHRPRVIWVGIKEDAPGHQLQHVQRAVENAISPLGYPTEARDFSPHLTLGRLARDVRALDLKKVGDVIGASGVGSLGRWDVTNVALIKSDLRPTGAVYTILARAPLAAR